MRAADISKTNAMVLGRGCRSGICLALFIQATADRGLQRRHEVVMARRLTSAHQASAFASAAR